MAVSTTSRSRERLSQMVRSIDKTCREEERLDTCEGDARNRVVVFAPV